LTAPGQQTPSPARTIVQRTFVHPAVLLLYFATGIVLIHDSLVAGWWGILAATVALMIGMIVVLALPERGAN